MFDDNANRSSRLAELVADTQSIISESKKAFKKFQADNALVTGRLNAVYKKAGLNPPKVSNHNLLAATALEKKVATLNKEVKIANVVIDMVGAGAMAEMAPAATVLLVDAQVLTEAEAGTAILSMLGTDITVGSALGGIIGAVVAGAVGATVGGALTVFTGQSQAHELKGGIAATKRVRLASEISRQKVSCVADVVSATKTACDALLKVLDAKTLDEAAITNLIEKKAKPALKKMGAITRNSAIASLYELDIHRNSWMTDG